MHTFGATISVAGGLPAEDLVELLRHLDEGDAFFQFLEAFGARVRTGRPKTAQHVQDGRVDVTPAKRVVMRQKGGVASFGRVP